MRVEHIVGRQCSCVVAEGLAKSTVMLHASLLVGALFVGGYAWTGTKSVTAVQESTEAFSDRTDQLEVATIIEQLRLVGSYTAFTVTISRFQGKQSDILEGEKGQNLLTMIVHGGAREAGLYSYDELDSKFREVLAVARTKKPDVAVWEETYAITKSRLAKVQRNLRPGGQGNHIKTPYCDVFYDPDNDHISVVRLGRGPVIWDTASLMQPLVIGPGNLERIAACEWTHEPFALGGKVHRFVFSGVAGYGEIVTDTNGLIVAASSHFGPLFEHTARFKFNEALGRDPQVRLRAGLYVSLQGGVLHAYSFTIQNIALDDQSPFAYLGVPRSAGLFDFRAEKKYFLPDRAETWPPEIRDFVRPVDHPYDPRLREQHDLMEPTSLLQSPEQLPRWVLLAGAIVVVMACLRYVYARRQRES
jgi:hypothetical protein